MRSIIPNQFRVQFHMTGHSPQSVILCCIESPLPQYEQALGGANWMAARRSLVGKMCTATYHVEIKESDKARERRLSHTLSHITFGYW
jgi:hypothetical protein